MPTLRLGSVLPQQSKSKKNSLPELTTGTMLMPTLSHLPMLTTMITSRMPEEEQPQPDLLQRELSNKTPISQKSLSKDPVIQRPTKKESLSKKLRNSKLSPTLKKKDHNASVKSELVIVLSFAKTSMLLPSSIGSRSSISQAIPLNRSEMLTKLRP